MELLQTRSSDGSQADNLSVDPYRSIKYGIWAYYLLIIFEGALRKWFLPGLATPLLVVRDPIAIWLVYQGWKRNLFPSTIYLQGVVIIGLIGIYTALFTGHGNLFVAIFGARILLVHFPLMFLMGRVLDRDDILKIGKVTLYIAVPMVILISMQFYSPQSAWVNRGLAGDVEGAGFSGSGEFKRPPGTFSFTNGVSIFFGWLAPFVFYFWFNLKKVNKWLLIAATGAMLAAIPFSISRSLFFFISITLTFAIIASLRKPENFKRIFAALIFAVIALGILSQTKFFTTATAAFTDRFTTANESEGGLVKGVIVDRFFGGMFTALDHYHEMPFFGYGIGMGTNVGSQLLTGQSSFLMGEGEWARIIGELGPLMGILLILLRVGFVFTMFFQCYRYLVSGDLLPWLFISFGLTVMIQGPLQQPTSLGFFIMIGGMLLASLKPTEDTDTDNADPKII